MNILKLNLFVQIKLNGLLSVYNKIKNYQQCHLVLIFFSTKPIYRYISRWTRRFLTGYLKDGVILDIMDWHDMIFLTCVPNLSSVAWLEVCQEPPILEVHTLRMLMVPDWILGWWGHSGHHGSSWYMILDLCTKFQLSSMNRSVSRTPRPGSHT